VYSADDSDLSIADTLVEMIDQPEASQRKNIDRLLSEVPPSSRYFAIASQSAAILHIQENRFSDAWSCLQPESDREETLQLSLERLKLWLLLEAESAERAEGQFKKLVRLTLEPDLDEKERAMMAEFLGGVIGMLRTQDFPTTIEQSTLETGERVLRNLRQRAAVMRFSERMQRSNQRAFALVSRLREFESIDLDAAERIVTDLRVANQENEREMAALKNAAKEKGKEKEDLEKSRRRLFDDMKVLQVKLNIEAPNKPFPPKPPTAPREPQPTYRKNRETGQMEIDRKPSPSDISKYQRELAKYKKDENRYFQDLKDYPQKLAQWNQLEKIRRESVLAEIAKTNQSIKELDAEISGAKESIRSGVAKELKDSNGDSKTLKEQLYIAERTLNHLQAGDAKPQSLLRPSHFDLLDFSSESARMKQLLQRQSAKP
jgi:hypothetical protein